MAAALEGTLAGAELSSPDRAVLLLTPEGLRCASPSLSGDGIAVVWDVPWACLLLVQQQGCQLRMLTLQDAANNTTSATLSREVRLCSEDDAARLHEVVRLAALNAKGAALPPSCSWSLVRTTLLAPPQPDDEVVRVS